MDSNNYKTRYCYFVTYEENGMTNSDSWSAETLAEELLRNEVKILRVDHVDTLDSED